MILMPEQTFETSPRQLPIEIQLAVAGLSGVVFDALNERPLYNAPLEVVSYLAAASGEEAVFDIARVYLAGDSEYSARELELGAYVNALTEYPSSEHLDEAVKVSERISNAAQYGRACIQIAQATDGELRECMIGRAVSAALDPDIESIKNPNEIHIVQERILVALDASEMSNDPGLGEEAIEYIPDLSHTHSSLVILEMLRERIAASTNEAHRRNLLQAVFATFEHTSIKIVEGIVSFEPVLDPPEMADLMRLFHPSHPNRFTEFAAVRFMILAKEYGLFSKSRQYWLEQKAMWNRLYWAGKVMKDVSAQAQVRAGFGDEELFIRACGDFPTTNVETIHDRTAYRGVEALVEYGRYRQDDPIGRLAFDIAARFCESLPPQSMARLEACIALLPIGNAAAFVDAADILTKTRGMQAMHLGSIDTYFIKKLLEGARHFR